MRSPAPKEAITLGPRAAALTGTLCGVMSALTLASEPKSIRWDEGLGFT